MKMLYFTLSPSFSLCVCLSPVSITSLLRIISSRNNLSSFPKICKKKISLLGIAPKLCWYSYILSFPHTFFPYMLLLQYCGQIVRSVSRYLGRIRIIPHTFFPYMLLLKCFVQIVKSKLRYFGRIRIFQRNLYWYMLLLQCCGSTFPQHGCTIMAKIFWSYQDPDNHIQFLSIHVAATM